MRLRAAGLDNLAAERANVHVMDQAARKDRISAAATAGRCPECWGTLRADRVGSGRIADGIFCSLDCFSTFHAGYLLERAQASGTSRN